MFHIIDDDHLMCDLLGAVVAKMGGEYICFYSAEAYLKFMQTRCFNAPIALLTDYWMQGMNGSDLAEAVHGVFPQQQIILVSGSNDEDNEEKILNHFRAILPKPFHIEKLIVLLKELNVAYYWDSSRFPAVCV